jgi:hypothetical protein
MKKGKAISLFTFLGLPPLRDEDGDGIAQGKDGPAGGDDVP